MTCLIYQDYCKVMQHNLECHWEQDWKGFHSHRQARNKLLTDRIVKALSKKEWPILCCDPRFFSWFFFNLHQLPAAKKGMKKPSITTNVWSFLFSQSFSMTVWWLPLVFRNSCYIWQELKMTTTIYQLMRLRLQEGLVQPKNPYMKSFTQEVEVSNIRECTLQGKP